MTIPIYTLILSYELNIMIINIQNLYDIIFQFLKDFSLFLKGLGL